MDRQNLLAVAWAWLYCFSLVVGSAAMDTWGVTPFVIVPLAVVVLPFLVTLPFLFFRRPGTEEPDG